MIKTVFFDFFDVIRTDAYKAWLDTHNHKLEGDFLVATQQLDRGEISVNDFFERLGRIVKRPANSIKREMGNSAKIDYHVLEVVALLSKNYSIGLLSNAPSDFLREILQTSSLERYFDEIIISSEVGYTKPSAEIFNLALSKFDVKASEAVFIDDDERNTMAAERLGIKSIQFLSIEQLRKDLAEAGLRF